MSQQLLEKSMHKLVQPVSLEVAPSGQVLRLAWGRLGLGLVYEAIWGRRCLGPKGRGLLVAIITEARLRLVQRRDARTGSQPEGHPHGIAAARLERELAVGV